MLDALTNHTVDMTMLHKNQHQLDAVKTKLGATKETSLLGKSGPTMDAINESAKDFEAVFVTEMLKPMFEGIKSDTLFGGGQTEEVFKGMMLQEYGKIIARSSSIGVADFVREEMIRIQEAQGGLGPENQDTTTTDAVAATQSYDKAGSAAQNTQDTNTNAQEIL